MNLFSAKLSLLFAFILAVINGQNFIAVDRESFTIDFQTNDSVPIFEYVALKNTGVKKVRFDVLTDADWIFIHREGYSVGSSLELAQDSSILFVLEINPSRFSDGQQKTLVKINAVDVHSYAVLETKEIPVIVNKNFTSLPSPSSAIAVSSVTPLSSAQYTPAPATTLIYSILVTPKITPALQIFTTPSITTPPPTILKVSPKVEDQKYTIDLDEKEVKSTSFFRSVWEFFKGLF